MLALIGSGEYLPPMEPVDRWLLAQLPAPARVVCLPTAAGTEGAERVAYWSELGLAHFSRLCAQVQSLPLIARRDAANPDFVAAIAASNFVYLSGGKPRYLYRALQGTPAWEAILSVHRRGGVVAGCSAGAMIMGEKVLGFPGLHAGFNLLPGAVILPHYDEIPERLKDMAFAYAGKHYRLLGVPGDTALVVNGQGQQVIGAHSVADWSPGAAEPRWLAPISIV